MAAVRRPPEFHCPRCWRRHRLWRTLGACLMRPTEWVVGAGPWGSVSDCPRGRTIKLHETEAEALVSVKFINRWRCGGVCCLRHYVVNLLAVARSKELTE